MQHLKALFLASVLLASNLAQANQWTALGLFDIGTFYVDTDNITSSGDHRKAWTMLDYREPKVHAPTGQHFKSTRMQMEFDCKDQTVHTLSLSYHTGVRLTGDTLSTEGVISPFEPVPPDTPIYKIMRLVC
jgi:hypothetical protein